MKSKKLLVSLAIIAVVVVIIVVMASVFSVRHVSLRYHTFNGDLVAVTGGDIPEEVIEKIAKGKSTVFLSKTSFLSQVNVELRANPSYSQWHAFAVVKGFPNKLEIHLVKRTAIARLTLPTGDIYLDSFGCKVNEVPEYDCIDITSAFSVTEPAAEQPKDGTFLFADEKSNQQLSCVLEAILATWQCYVEIDEMNIVLDATRAFEFEDGNMIIRPRLGGKIVIMSPETDLTARLQKAYAVYYNSNVNLQDDDWVITVLKNGRIRTPDPNKR